MAQYCPADTTAAAEWMSFDTQMTKIAKWRENYEEPSDQEMQLTLAWLEDQYRGIPSIDSSWFTRSRFENLLSELDLTSTPGIPYLREAPTIGQWLGADGLGNYSRSQVERLWYDVCKLYNGEWEHRFRVFVKDEPHKVAKRDQNRWRLIMCASLANQMLWRMALKHQNDWLNASAYKCPSAHGLVFCYGGWRRFKAHVATKRLSYSRDLTSWDLSSPGWVWRVVREFRKRAGGPLDWLRAMDRLYEDAFEKSIYQFSNGMVVRKDISGVMESGLFVTISDNSLAMACMHFLASLRSGQYVGSVWATGDDVLHTYISDAYITQLEKLGCRVKEWTAELEFMGTSFVKEPKPLYLAKHIVSFMTKKADVRAEVLDAYARLWCHDDEWFEFWSAVAKSAGVSLRSRAYYRFWYSSPLAAQLAKLW